MERTCSCISSTSTCSSRSPRERPSFAGRKLTYFNRKNKTGYLLVSGLRQCIKSAGLKSLDSRICNECGKEPWIMVFDNHNLPDDVNRHTRGRQYILWWFCTICDQWWLQFVALRHQKIYSLMDWVGNASFLNLISLACSSKPAFKLPHILNAKLIAVHQIHLGYEVPYS